MFGFSRHKNRDPSVETKARPKVRVKMVVTRKDGSQETYFTTGEVKEIKDG